MRKATIPKALREQVWLIHNSMNYNAKCNVQWCSNIITPFSFEVGHNIPESKGGTLDINNLRPICSSCNRSMGNRYTIDEFSALSSPIPSLIGSGPEPTPMPTQIPISRRFLCCWKV